jgi:hypothetical protein
MKAHHREFLEAAVALTPKTFRKILVGLPLVLGTLGFLLFLLQL